MNQPAPVLNSRLKTHDSRLEERAVPTGATLPSKDQTDANLWQQAMLQGDFEQAWQATDRIRARNAPDPHRFWQGEPIAGKRLMLRSLHGFGDALQFLRYLPALNALAQSVTLEVDPRLAPLARHLAGATSVITWNDRAPTYDLQIEIMELPYVFRTQPADLPIATQYLQLPGCPVSSQAERRATWAQSLPSTSRKQIGIVTTAGRWNPARAIPEALLAPLLTTPNCEFWNLNPHPTALPLHQHPGTDIDLLALANLISQLDLVVTPDTLAAHLAGALGTPAWVLLQHTADWRWQHARPDCPWYPTHRLFRQPTPGDWPAVLAQVAHELTSNPL